jgi:PAS domain S-box-containing protein
MAAPLLADLAAELPIAVALVRSDGAVRYANPRLGVLLGVDAEDIAGRALDDLLGAPGAHQALVTLAVGAEGQELELRCRRADDREIWVLASGRPRDGGADVLAVFVEVTERHRLETERAEQTAALELLAELPEKNPGPVGRLARDGTVLMANAAARAFIGEGDIRGRCWVDLCPGMTWDIWQRVLDVEPGAGTRVVHEAERDGTYVLFSHVRSGAGDLVFVYGADITARHRDEEQLAEQAAQLREVARFPEMNPGPVLRTDPEGQLLMANAAARNVFGEELIGRDWRRLCPDLTEDFWGQVLSTPGVLPHEARVGDAEYVFAHRHDPTSGLVFVFGADITAQKQAERALRQSERMATLGTLAAGVAHELNNPAAAARRAADQIQEAFADLEAAHLRLDAAALSPAAQELLREIDALARLQARRPTELGPLERADREAEVEDWLDEHDVDDAWALAPALVALGLAPDRLDQLADEFTGDRLSAALAWSAGSGRVHMLAHEIGQGSSRISEIVGALKSYSYLGRAPVQSVDLHEGLDNTLVILRNKLKHGIEVTRDYGPDIPPVCAFGGELNQVWTNLLDNAADAMGGHGHLTIRTRRDGDWAVVEVVDDGPGIPESIRGRIFDPFFTTKEPGKGTGLGLSTSYSIVTEKHQGSITVTSVPGSTCFTVRLPIDSGSAAPAESES